MSDAPMNDSAPARKPLSKSLRFNVFKRDKFTCQYCGAKSPDCILQVDHITPVSKGGTNDIMNLVTSCAPCNAGKYDRSLGDDTAVQKSRLQAELSQDRREQIEMMAEWQTELARLEPEMDALISIITNITGGMSLTENGKRALRKHVRQSGLREVIAAVAIAFDQYDREEAFSKIGPILYCRLRAKRHPDAEEIALTVHGHAKRFSRVTSWKKNRAIDILITMAERGLNWRLSCRDAAASAGYNYDDYVAFLDGVLNG